MDIEPRRQCIILIENEMQKLKFSINGTKYEATVAEKEHNVAEVELNGKKYVVEVERAESVAMPHLAAPKHAPATQAAAPAAAPKAASANSITSPLPGSIISVNVKTGDAVKAGDTLIFIEAMKMENELMAPADGTVKNVYVSAGQAVQQGDALVDLA